MMNRIGNARNPYQGDFKKVLCVCSAGLLRSPTAAFVLANEFGCNTRAAGLSAEYALIPVDDVLLSWADEVVCMSDEQAEIVDRKLVELRSGADVISLNIPDNFAYRNPALVELIREAYADGQRQLKEKETDA